MPRNCWRRYPVGYHPSWSVKWRSLWIARVLGPEAKEHREKFMQERKYFVWATNQDLFERPFPLCEH